MTDPQRTKSREKIFFLIAAMTMWIVACFLPAYSDGTPGIECFLTGWGCIAEGKFLAFAAWLSNFLWWPAWFMFLFSKSKGAGVAVRVFLIMAFVFSFGCFEVTTIHHGVFGTGYTAYVHLSYGGYVWIGAYALLLLGSIADWFNGNPR